MGQAVDNCIQLVFSRFSLMAVDNWKDYISRQIIYAKQKLAIETLDTVFNSSHPIVLDSYIEEYSEFDNFYVRIHYRFTAVQSRNVIVPALVFTNHIGEIEWKCPYCSTINPIKATFCGEQHKNAVGCGSPREKTIQEYQ